MESTNDDASRKSYGTTTKQHYTTSTHTAARQLHVQDISTASNEHIPTTATASYTSSTQHVTATTTSHISASQNTRSATTNITIHTKHSIHVADKGTYNYRTTNSYTETKSSSTKHTPSATCSTITDIHTNVNTDNTNTHTHTNSTTCGTYTCSRVRQMDSYSGML